MENQNLLLSNKEKKIYLNLITGRFLTNPRMSMLFDNKSKSFEKNVFNLVHYCFCLAYKNQSVYVAKNKKTIMFFYEKSNFKKNIFDFFRYLKVIKGIPIFKIINILKTENKTKLKRMKLDNYIYVWFIAQEKGYGKLDGLIEINNFLQKLSNDRNLPIIFETSDQNLMQLYQRAGFEIYDFLKLKNDTIYYLINKKI